MKKIGLVLIVALAFGACSSGNATKAGRERPKRTDDAGHLIATGQDWSGAGNRTGDVVDPKATPLTSSLYKVLPCGVPPTLSPEQEKALPPNYDPYSGFPPAKNDFDIQASISPEKGDPGTRTTITATAVGRPGALIVIVARFFDGKHHGMRAAQFADALGRATLTGPIPKDAPVGIVTIAVSASTRDKKSSLETVRFIVTGPGCR
jgi:hypothetical protein